MKKNLALLGIPYDASSSFLEGAAKAPTKIREVLHGGSTNLTTELGVDLEKLPIDDRGDLKDTTREGIATTVELYLRSDDKLLTLGGDHSITYPILRGHFPRHGKMTVVQIDAHPDLYDELDGDLHSHACPFARAMEDGLVERLIQIGIRTLNTHQREQAERFGVEIIDMIAWENGTRPDLSGPIYLTVDLDGLDPSEAPGVSHHEPGGLTMRELLRFIQGLEVPILGADIVELNPRRDLHDRTAMVAAKLLKEIAAKMLS